MFIVSMDNQINDKNKVLSQEINLNSVIIQIQPKDVQQWTNQQNAQQWICLDKTNIDSFLFYWDQYRKLCQSAVLNMDQMLSIYQYFCPIVPHQISYFYCFYLILTQGEINIMRISYESTFQSTSIIPIITIKSLWNKKIIMWFVQNWNNYRDLKINPNHLCLLDKEISVFNKYYYSKINNLTREGLNIADLTECLYQELQQEYCCHLQKEHLNDLQAIYSNYPYYELTTMIDKTKVIIILDTKASLILLKKDKVETYNKIENLETNQTFFNYIFNKYHNQLNIDNDFLKLADVINSYIKEPIRKRLMLLKGLMILILLTMILRIIISVLIIKNKKI